MSHALEIDTAGSSTLQLSRFAVIEARIDELAQAPQPSEPAAIAAELLRLGEATLEIWIEAHGQVPTNETREGFRLLALHRQGAKGQPSFNACRETARELVFHHNLIAEAPEAMQTAQTVVMMTLVAKHLVYFVEGKMTVDGLGEFCCAAKPMRVADAAV